MRFSSPKPRNGHTLIVGIVARISGCQNQKEMSLEDQVDHGKEVIAEIFDGATDFRPIATKGKGERLDRPELLQIEDMIRTSELDVLVMEDVGRLVRGGAAVRLWGIAVDHGTRCIAPNDCVDTIEDTWEEDLLAACRDHVGHQSHTSRRLKKKQMNRFKKFGGAMALPPAGYIKPEGAETYDDWVKDDSFEAAKLPDGKWTIVKGAEHLKVSLNCTEVADWFNQIGFRTGKYCQNQEWDGAMVRRLYENPLLKGFARRGTKHTEKHHETGRRRSVKNPAGPEYYECPHLQYLAPHEFDELNRRLDERNERFRRKKQNGVDPLQNVPRKRTRFPGQHAQCYYCGHLCVWGGNGMTDNLMCSNSRKWHCWNSVGFNGELFNQRLSTAVFEALGQLDGFEDQYREMIIAASRNSEGDVSERQKTLKKREASRQQAWDNLTAAIKQFGPLDRFTEEIELLQQQKVADSIEKAKLQSIYKRQLQLPRCLNELQEMILEEMDQLAVDSPEYGHLMRLLVPDVSVHLVRLCDGGHLLPRARIRLDLLGSIEDADLMPSLKASLAREVSLDIFEPTQRERIREESDLLRRAGNGPKAIARMLQERPKYQTVSKALALHDQMMNLGLDEPYVFIDAPPGDYQKLKRHRNSKYSFQPLEGYQPPEI